MTIHAEQWPLLHELYISGDSPQVRSELGDLLAHVDELKADLWRRRPDRFEVVRLDYGWPDTRPDTRYGVVDHKPADGPPLLVLRANLGAARAVAAAANGCPDEWDTGAVGAF